MSRIVTTPSFDTQQKKKIDVTSVLIPCTSDYFTQALHSNNSLFAAGGRASVLTSQHDIMTSNV